MSFRRIFVHSTGLFEVLLCARPCSGHWECMGDYENEGLPWEGLPFHEGNRICTRKWVRKHHDFQEPDIK